MNESFRSRRAPRAPGSPVARRLRALARALLPRPAHASRLAELALGTDGVSAFRRLVRMVLPGREATIMAAGRDGEDRESARVEAFLDHVDTLFPIEYPERYRDLLAGIPSRREGWWGEGQDLSNLPLGDLLLLAVVADPYDTGFHDALREHLPTFGIPAALLRELPTGGATPGELADHFLGTRWEAVAQYAAWVHGCTGSVFLDCSPEDTPRSIAWTRGNVALLTEQARAAERLLRAIRDLSTWLVADPARRCAELVAAVTGDRSGALLALIRGAIEDRWAASFGGTAPYLEIPDDRHDAIPVPVGRSETPIRAGAGDEWR